MHHYQNTCQGNFSLHLWMTTPTPRKHDPIFFTPDGTQKEAPTNERDIDMGGRGAPTIYTPHEGRGVPLPPCPILHTGCNLHQTDGAFCIALALAYVSILYVKRHLACPLGRCAIPHSVGFLSMRGERDKREDQVQYFCCTPAQKLRTVRNPTYAYWVCAVIARWV